MASTLDANGVLLLLRLRVRDAEYFVGECEAWSDRLTKSALPIDPERLAIRQRIEELTKAYRRATNRSTLLVAAEALADLIVASVRDGKLPTRIPPTDALECYRNMGAIDSTCELCGGQTAHHGVCTKCLIDAEKKERGE